jgi:hypothetical protein
MRSRALLLLAMLLVVCLSPVAAGTLYSSGKPDLSAALSGANEFTPGRDITFTVLLRNSGLNEVQIIDPRQQERDDPPNLAKLVTAGLSPGDAPVVIKSGAQMVGDIPGGASVPVSFSARIREGAPAGDYLLPLSVSYSYLYDTEQVGVDTVILRYQEENQTLAIPIRIKPVVGIAAGNVSTEYLNAGTQGIITVNIRNTGHATGESAVAKIERSGTSPVIPVDSSVYLGTFPPGAVVTARFKVLASGDADAASYPLDLVVMYTNAEGDLTSTDPVTLGVPVGGKIAFAVVSDSTVITPGSEQQLTVVYENTGASTAYSAQARISATDPFSSTDDTASLGDIRPGERVEARFAVSADKSATIKEYALDTEVRYRDGLGTIQISDPIRIPIQVVPRRGISQVTGNPILVSIIIATLIGAGYYVYRWRSSRKKDNA